MKLESIIHMKIHWKKEEYFHIVKNKTGFIFRIYIKTAVFVSSNMKGNNQNEKYMLPQPEKRATFVNMI